MIINVYIYISYILIWIDVVWKRHLQSRLATPPKFHPGWKRRGQGRATHLLRPGAPWHGEDLVGLKPQFFSR